MMNARLWRCLVLTSALCGMTPLFVACDKPVVGQAGQPVATGGMEFSVGELDVRYLELSSGGETFEYPKPVLLVPLTITNKGQDAKPYVPTHDAPQMSEASTPLLYADPGPEAKLPPASKTPIPGALLKRGALPGQRTEAATLAPGESLTDLLVFQLPPKELTSLILSVPPTLHRGKMPALIRLPYSPQEPSGPKVYAQGQPVPLAQAILTLERVQIDYIPIEDTAQGKGFSSEPLLKLSYSIKNEGDAPLIYEPNHKAVSGAAGARLSSAQEGAYNRITFAATTQPEGQLKGKITIKPKSSIEDFVLFERPGEDVKELSLEIPASLFNQPGLARISVPYAFKEPELPAALKKSAPPKPEGSPQ